MTFTVNTGDLITVVHALVDAGLTDPQLRVRCATTVLEALAYAEPALCTITLDEDTVCCLPYGHPGRVHASAPSYSAEGGLRHSVTWQVRPVVHPNV